MYTNVIKSELTPYAAVNYDFICAPLCDICTELLKV